MAQHETKELAVPRELVERALDAVRDNSADIAASALLLAAAFVYGIGGGDLAGFIKTATECEEHVQHGRDVAAAYDASHSAAEGGP